MPDYITHVLRIDDDGVIQMGPKDDICKALNTSNETTPEGAGLGCVQSGKVLLDLKNVNISYKGMPVCNRYLDERVNDR